MAIRVAIKHKTTYHYDRPVTLSPHIFRLRPAVHSRTPIEAYSFKLTPKDHFIHWQQDPFGNYQARVVFPEKTTALTIDVEVIARMEVINPFDFFVEEYAEKFPFRYSSQLQKELVPYLEKETPGTLLQAWLGGVDTTEKGIVDFLVYINQRINKDIAYTIRMEPGVQTPEDTLSKALGSCRDSAWLLVQVLRHLGLAARFVSGYLVQLTADVKSLDGPSGPAADFTDLHAWTEVYIPGAGWVGLDPTSGLFAGEGHIPLACTPHYTSAAPVVGATDKATVTFEFDNSVTRIHEDPRVTKPYTEAQWAAIEALGYSIDADLDAGDVRMTMGGEPTFVSIDDMESEQWNTTADGKDKRVLSHELIFRLRDKFGENGMIHYGQGKWYPGEPLPRWQYGLYWRKDGYPIWRNIELIAQEQAGKRYTHEEAGIFITELAKHLAISSDNISAAYEDSFFFLWSEGKIPVNIDPLKAGLKDSIERRTLAQLLDKGLDAPAGYVLPLQWNYWNNTWLSCKWVLNREQLFLLPGNSPIGLRLPLDSLPVVSKAATPQEVERSLFDELPALESYHEMIPQRYGMVYDFVPEPKKQYFAANNNEEQNKPPEASPVRQPGTADKEENITFEVQTIKTALCVEARDGIIYIFLPPMQYLEHYLDAVASIEATAAKLSMPVRIEGYEPPRDYRMERLVVSPDPGVIEVNIHPAKNWAELLINTNTLYEQAYLSRLGTEKFMLDGRHTGTGGGNHITIGGATPSDSPLLRRPDLLRSLVTYWQHHPGLSYLFSGSFIGPTSQAPRIDEGRDEKLYEMEIAFSQVPDPGEGFVPFWLVDRIFRHLLTDITGNTHRSEFCIDKLYSPDSSSGRLGILEFRAFDMPPHKQMSLLQMLLLRALVAKFWKQPYKHGLVRWGTQLHDKFMLPYYVRQDIAQVVEDLNNAGYPFDINWFDAYFEFRFPHYGTTRLQGIEMEIRMGIEPWHVLGEEMSSSGTARFVDSSLERIQVTLRNFTAERYVLLCNGCRVPLKETVTSGVYVCGIRYRAWQPPSALHPTIGVDTPLVFDIVDTWNSRSIGGCTYHVAHPGGRNYDTFPINAYEAESRRISRFWDHGHTQETIQPRAWFTDVQHYITHDRQPFKTDVPAITINNDYPCTLDLRQFRAQNKK
ncbi:transglutaminase family protein [Panacibacter sp. DH6]|uniref:Transglutaminase family protein n=1 Tax=Panacibacter microcysteis TaxID=2793269 RepID=A0A931E5E2_9BACT|nr:transglutaminase family protein [Panacibacter microcysteis]MBG9377373.1 transglutaminase family protein [Panacibacter microcysteis]